MRFTLFGSKAICNNMAQNYSGQDLQNQNFERQNLVGADFSRADIRGANFTRARLYNANFSDANIQGAKFNYANLRAAKFTNASIDNDKPPSCIVDFSNSKIQGTDFNGAVLNHANFYKAKAGLNFSHYILVILVTFIICILSSFTSTIACTFAAYYFFLTLRQKPSSLVLLFTWLSSVIFIVTLRTFFLNSFAITVHVFLGIALIIVTTVAVFAVTVSIDDSNPDIGYIIWIVIALVSLLVLFLFTPSLKGIENFLISQFPVLGIFVKGLGDTTKGAWVAGIFGAAIGGGLGWRFSQLALGGDKRFSWLWKMYVEFAASGGTVFIGANLTDANFTSASLRGANFKGSKTKRTRWSKARYFEYACVTDGYLTIPKVQRLVITQKVARQNPSALNFDGLNLEGINLQAADLSSASFVGTNLNQANLHGADLTQANLKNAKLDGADLSEANLTGATIGNWTISSKTKLDNVKCEYVFLTEYADSISGIRERLPHAPNKFFKPGEFENLYTENIETLQLLIRNNDNRQALTAAFLQLIKNNPGIKSNDLQSVERVGSDVLVKIRVSPDTDKGTVEQEFEQIYQQGVNQEIPQNEELQKIANAIEIDKNQPLFEFIWKLIEAIGERMTTKIITIHDGDYHEGDGNTTRTNTAGGNFIQGDYINMSQDLTQAAAQIQKLIEQLQKQKGVKVDVAENEVAKDLAKQANSDERIKEKLIKWKESLATIKWGESLATATVSEAFISVVKLACQSAGIPILFLTLTYRENPDVQTVSLGLPLPCIAKVT